jgi:signal transduction histidine kinase
VSYGGAVGPGSLRRGASFRAPRGAPDRASWSARARLVASFVALLAVVGAGAFLTVRELLLGHQTQRVSNDLVQETEALRRFAQRTDPRTGRPLGSNVRRMFHLYLQRNAPSRHEAFITFVDGSPFLRRGSAIPRALGRNRGMAQRLAHLTEPDAGSAPIGGGSVNYLAVPVQVGGRTRGVFVAAVSPVLERSWIIPAAMAAAGFACVLAAMGWLLAWHLAGSTLSRMRAVRNTALEISKSDLTRRVDVQGEDDEAAQLAHAFNEILEQVEGALTARKRLIDDAAYELQTPILAIREHLDRPGDDPRERARRVQLVVAELDRMSRFVEDLLLVARSHRPNFLELSTVDLGRLLEGVRAKVEVLASRRWQIESTGRGRIVADEHHLTQALMRLAQNAIQRTQDWDVIALGFVVLPGEARLWVRDGSSVAVAHLERIFERFLPTSGKDTDGAGLAIVRAIAVAHRGRVEVSSAGDGATFTIIVPVDQPELWMSQSGGAG